MGHEFWASDCRRADVVEVKVAIASANSLIPAALRDPAWSTHLVTSAASSA